MTTGHVLPGYKDTVSRLERARNAVHMGSEGRPGAANLKELQMIRADPVTLDEIRKRAREVWQHKDDVETSYQDHYRERFSAVDEHTQSRPTSSHRRNKPHPTGLFLTTRLHNCPGWHNPDTTMGKPQYQVDGSVSPGLQAERAGARAKYKPAKDQAALNQYRSQFPPEIEEMPDPRERQAAQAEYRHAPPREQILLVQQLRDQHAAEVDRIHENSLENNRPQSVPALNRYMKWAGAEERESVHRMAAQHGGTDGTGVRSPVPVYARRQQELRSVRASTSLGQLQHRTRRGDFLLRPEWPPNIRHHRLNGLSSFDCPYIASTHRHGIF